MNGVINETFLNDENQSNNNINHNLRNNNKIVPIVYHYLNVPPASNLESNNNIQNIPNNRMAYNNNNNSNDQFNDKNNLDYNPCITPFQIDLNRMFSNLNVIFIGVLKLIEY